MTLTNQQATIGSQTFNYFCSAECMVTALREMTMQQLSALYGYTKGAPNTSVKSLAHQFVKDEVAARTLETPNNKGGSK